MSRPDQPPRPAKTRGNYTGDQLRLIDSLSSKNGELIGSLDAIASTEQGVEMLERLLPAELLAGLDRIEAYVKQNGHAEIMLDSDGTGFMSIDESMRADFTDKTFPGDAIIGEPPQQYVRDLRVTKDQVAVWQALAESGITVSIFSGRKAGDLSDTYAAALGIEGFAMFSAKGRGMITAEGITLSPELQEKLTDDPLGQVANRMADVIIRNAVNEMHLEPEAAAAQQQVLTDLWSAASQGDTIADKELERETGYRVSRQYVDDKVVLIRLHHLHRACQLAEANGVQGTSNPNAVDRHKFSSWLLSEDATARRIREQLLAEDAAIMSVWEQTLGSEGYAQLHIQTTDHVAHRSFCQDMAPVADISTLLRDREVLLYAGDNATVGGNDRLAMESLHRIRPDSVSVAVHHGTEKNVADLPSHAVQADQFQLFLAQYALLKRLQKKA